jgi:phosphatidylglycerophosphatase C
MKETVVFDLDGTLLSTDSIKTWLIIQFKTNFFRFLCAILILPIGLLCLKFKKHQVFGISLFMWCATFGLTENQLKENFYDFALKIKEHKIPHLYWFHDGLIELKNHINQNRRVVIATAAPEILVTQLFHSLEIDIEILATPLKQTLKGWTVIPQQYCRYEEKVNRLKQLEIHAPWLATYSDHIKDDLPILMSGQHAYLINSKVHPIKNTQISELHYLYWG